MLIISPEQHTASKTWPTVEPHRSPEVLPPIYFKTHTTGTGALLFAGQDKYGAAGEAPSNVVLSLPPRDTQITALELLGVAGGICTFLEHIRGRDLLVFCDNQGACSAIVKGASKAKDLQLFSTALHNMCRLLHIFPWVERVPTDAHPADELSR